MKPYFQDEAIRAVHAYIRGDKVHDKALCLAGPPGSGKTMTVHYVAELLGRKVVTFHGDEDEDIDALLRSSSLFGPRLIVVDEVSQSVPLAKLLAQRAVLTTTDLYDGVMKTMRTKVHVVRMHVYSPNEVTAILCKKFPQISVEVGATVASQCGTDIRYAENMLTYALATAKAKKPGHKTVLTPSDAQFDLFKDVERAFAGHQNSGIQSGDFFMYSSMLQANAPVRAKKLVRVMDGFAHLDVMDASLEFTSEQLMDATATVLALTQPAPKPITMPMFPNPGNKIKNLQAAADSRSHDAVSLYERIAAMNVSGRVTKAHAWYHEDADIRALRKTPFKGTSLATTG